MALPRRAVLSLWVEIARPLIEALGVRIFTCDEGRTVHDSDIPDHCFTVLTRFDPDRGEELSNVAEFPLAESFTQKELSECIAACAAQLTARMVGNA